MKLDPITYVLSPSRPTTRLPAGAVDTHCHILGPVSRFPYAPDNRTNPGEAPKETLFALHDLLGIERGVLVQAGYHGYDNSVLSDAMAARPGRYRAIALAPATIGAEEMARLSSEGFCGIRFNYISHLSPGASADELRALGPRLAEAGWQLVVHMSPDRIEDMTPILSAMPVPVVVDHMGRIDASAGPDQAPFAALLRLMEREHLWTKVSCSERASALDYPYPDATLFARRLVEAFPDRVLWGSDWPHPNFREAPPDDGRLLDLLPKIAPNPTQRQALMVDNPARLYGFG